MPTQEDQLASISSASLAQTQAVIDLKASLTALVTEATNQFIATIERVNELSSVDNVADANKIISTLMQAALNTKQDELVSGENLSTINGKSILSGDPLVIERSPTSLTSLTYANALLLRTPIVPLPIKDDSVVVEGIGLFVYVENTLEPDDSETCFTAKHPTTGLPIGQWLLMIPAYEWNSAHLSIQKSILMEYMDDNN